MNNENKPVIACVREFKLRQQYPSMITKSKNVGKTVAINASLKSLIPVTTSLKSKMNTRVKNGFHKFRLKLPSGKDLGECNVQILPNINNILKDRTVKIIKQNKCKTLNKSVVLLSINSKNKTKNVAGNIPLLSINSTVQQDVQCYEGIKNRGTENMDTHIITDKECHKNGRFEHGNIQRILENNKQLINKNSFVELTDYLSFSRPVKMANNNPLFPLIEVPSYSVNTSGPIAKTVENNCNIANSGSQNYHRLNEKKKYLLTMGDGNVNLSLEQEPNKIDLKSDTDKSTPEYKNIIRDNGMVIVDDNETSLVDNSMKTICNDNIPIVTATSCYKNSKSQDVFTNTFQPNENQYNIEQNIDKPSKEHHADENSSLKKTCSSCSVLKEVMSIIENKNLKVKALKALADCGIETKQQNTSDIPKDTRTVPDTKVQTETYSLFESENILNIKEDTFSTVKMTPKGSYFENIPENLNVNQLHYIPFYENSTFSPFNQLQESDWFLENSINGNVINDICNKHSTANKVKEVLSQPNVLCNKIFEQLQRDFETVTKWDENGMLNIHKAVISNRTYDIQRHLMVFKACNVNVDTPTQSGMTNLELAIKYNASTEIVKLLLEAGANPASFQPIHDSALIIASKISSSLLPLLINHVPSSKLLDYVDFKGFAALHYCAQCGNLEGVNLLINKGANVNLRESRSGRTPLFLSIESSHSVIAEKLIENGAQADIPNFSGQTVMSLVEEVKHLSLVTLLHTIR